MKSSQAKISLLLITVLLILSTGIAFVIKQQNTQAAVPVLSGGSPANGATGVATNATLTINSDVALDTASVGSSTWSVVRNNLNLSFGLNLNGVYFTSATTGYAVGGSGIIVKTTDSGLTWTAQTSGVSTALKSVYFRDTNTGWAVGDSGTVLGTTNAGVTWTTQASGTGGSLWDLYFVDANTGYVTGNSGIMLKTTNGGTSWTSQDTLSGTQLYGVHFVDANIGWVTGNSGTILKTTNGGTSWGTLTSGTSVTLSGIYFTDANTGWAVGNTGTILKTTNGGTNWTAQTSGTGNTLWDLHFLDASNGYAVGDNGTIVRTANGGSTWAAQTSGTTQALLGITTFDNVNIYAFSGSFPYLVKQNMSVRLQVNAGNTQGGTPVGNNIFSNVAFSGDSKTITATHGGLTQGVWYTFTITTDLKASDGTPLDANVTRAFKTELPAAPTLSGGSPANGATGVALAASPTINADKALDANSLFASSWSLYSTISSTYIMNKAAFPGAATWYAVGNSGKINKTTNGGTSWSDQTSGTANTLNDIECTDTNTCYALGNSGTLIKTTNGGTTWSAQTSGTGNQLNDIECADANTCFAVGNSGTLIKTSNGSSWSSQSTDTSQHLNAIYFLDTNTGWIVGHNGTVLKTTNGGTSWTLTDLDTDGTGSGSFILHSVYFVDANTGWASSNSGNILKTTNGGSSWSLQVSGVNVDLTGDIYFIDTNRGYVLGGDDVLTTTNGGVTWTAESSSINNAYQIIPIDSLTHYVLDSGHLFKQDLSVTLKTNTGNTQNGAPTGSNLLTNVALSNGNQTITGTHGGLTLGQWYTLAITTDLQSSDSSPLTSAVTRVFRAVPVSLSSTSVTNGATGTNVDVALTADVDNALTSSDIAGWTAQTSGASNRFTSVYFVNTSTGYVVGDTTIRKTTDGGAAWSAQTSGTSNNLNGVTCVDSDTCYVVGASGTILKTTNGGTAWTAQTSGTNLYLIGVQFLDSNTGFVSGLKSDDLSTGVILKTTNGGSTWTTIKSGADTAVTRLYFADANTAWTVGANGIVLKTTNGGTTWTAQTSGSSALLRAVHFPSDTSTGWAVGHGGVILKTTNGGATWGAQTSGVSNDLIDVQFMNTSIGWAVGGGDLGGVLLKTTNGGTTWVTQTSGVSTELLGLHFPFSHKGWVVGASGVILTYDETVLLQANTGNTQGGAASGSSLCTSVTLGNDGSGNANRRITCAHSDLTAGTWYTLSYNISKLDSAATRVFQTLSASRGSSLPSSRWLYPAPSENGEKTGTADESAETAEELRPAAPSKVEPVPSAPETPSAEPESRRPELPSALTKEIKLFFQDPQASFEKIDQLKNNLLKKAPRFFRFLK